MPFQGFVGAESPAHPELPSPTIVPANLRTNLVGENNGPLARGARSTRHQGHTLLRSRSQAAAGASQSIRLPVQWATQVIQEFLIDITTGNPASNRRRITTEEFMAVLNDESKIKFTGRGDAPIVSGLYSAFYKQVIEHELRSDWFLNAGRAARNFCTLQSFSQVIGGVCVPIGAIMCAPIRMLERYLSNQDSASAFATTVTLLIFAACFLIVLLQVLVSYFMVTSENYSFNRLNFSQVTTWLQAS